MKEKTKRPKCAVCRSRRYHITDMGFWVCGQGHQLQVRDCAKSHSLWFQGIRCGRRRCRLFHYIRSTAEFAQNSKSARSIGDWIIKSGIAGSRSHSMDIVSTSRGSVRVPETSFGPIRCSCERIVALVSPSVPSICVCERSRRSTSSNSRLRRWKCLGINQRIATVGGESTRWSCRHVAIELLFNAAILLAAVISVNWFTIRSIFCPSIQFSPAFVQWNYDSFKASIGVLSNGKTTFSNLAPMLFALHLGDSLFGADQDPISHFGGWLACHGGEWYSAILRRVVFHSRISSRENETTPFGQFDWKSILFLKCWLWWSCCPQSTISVIHQRASFVSTASTGLSSRLITAVVSLWDWWSAFVFKVALSSAFFTFDATKVSYSDS